MPEYDRIRDDASVRSFDTTDSRRRDVDYRGYYAPSIDSADDLGRGLLEKPEQRGGFWARLGARRQDRQLLRRSERSRERDLAPRGPSRLDRLIDRVIRLLDRLRSGPRRYPEQEGYAPLGQGADPYEPQPRQQRQQGQRSGGLGGSGGRSSFRALFNRLVDWVVRKLDELRSEPRLAPRGYQPGPHGQGGPMSQVPGPYPHRSGPYGPGGPMEQVPGPYPQQPGPGLYPPRFDPTHPGRPGQQWGGEQDRTTGFVESFPESVRRNGPPEPPLAYGALAPAAPTGPERRSSPSLVEGTGGVSELAGGPLAGEQLPAWFDRRSDSRTSGPQQGGHGFGGTGDIHQPVPIIGPTRRPTGGLDGPGGTSNNPYRRSIEQPALIDISRASSPGVESPSHLRVSTARARSSHYDGLANSPTAEVSPLNSPMLPTIAPVLPHATVRPKGRR
jgi:hypothetical protein